MRRLRPITAGIVALTLALSGCAQQETTVGGITDPFVWSTYGTGTATYADLAAVSDAVATETGARVRIITSDTAIGRLAAMRGEVADMGRLGDEYMFGYEGENEFANSDWGPQNLAVVWAPLSPHSLMVREGDGMETPADLAGMRVPRIAANPSVNDKIHAYLAYGGLTEDDVEFVDLPYGEQAGALQDGQIDALYQQVYGSSLYELESTTPVRWLDLDPDDAEAAERIRPFAPAVSILPFEDAPGQEEGQETYGFIYTLPITTYAERSEDEVYALVQAMVDSFPRYENTTINTPRWNPDQVETMPKRTPFHPGTIRWLEENDKWTAEAQERNDALIERGEALRTQWEEYIATEPAEEDIPAGWAAWREEHVPEVPEVE